MNSSSKPRPGTIKKFFAYLRRHGPLGTMKRSTTVMRGHLNKVPGSKSLSRAIESLLINIQHHLDASFDRKYGVNTSGRILLTDLTTSGNNLKECFWYEPISAKIFRQIMRHLNLPFDQFEFIDFGSGKGRVLLLASDYGFKNIRGVEFAQELHRIAGENADIWNRNARKPHNIETVCMDAVEFSVPLGPLVIFFYCPFQGTVMEQVVNNLLASYTMNPRKIVIIYHGPCSETKKPLNLPDEFQGREIELRADWSKFIKYRCFLFFSPEVMLKKF